RRCCLLGGKHRGRGERGDDGNAAANQLGRQARQSIVIILRRAVFDRYILAVDITRVLEALTESAQTIHARVERIGVEESDHRHGRLLRTRRERPRRSRTAEQRNELTPFHQQFLPCFDAEDSTAGDLLHCGISKEPLSAVGLGCAKTPAPAAHVEASRRNCASWSRMMLRARCSIPCWRIVFSTFRRCMSFYTARVMSARSTGSQRGRHFRFAPESDGRPPRCKSVAQCQEPTYAAQQICTLLDHLVGAQQERLGDSLARTSGLRQQAC